MLKFSAGKEGDMLWTIVGTLLTLWIYGLISGVAGNLIHLLLVLAVAVLVFYVVTS